LALHERDIDHNPVTVLTEIGARGEADAFGGAEALEVYQNDDTGLPIEVLSYCQQLRGFTIAREQRKAGSKLITLSKTVLSPEDRVAKTKELLSPLERLSLNRRSLESFTEVIERIGVEKFCDPSRGEVFITSHWAQVNDVFMGFRRGRMYCIGAYTSHGKTTFILDYVLHAAMTQGTRIAYISLEMEAADLFRSCCCNLGAVSNVRVAKGVLEPDERERFMGAMARMETIPLRISNLVGHRTDDVLRSIRHLRGTGFDVDVVVIDHLQLMRPSGKSRDYREQFTEISHALLDMALHENVAVVGLSQLRKRDGRANKNERPMMDDLRETGSFAEDSNSVMLLYRPEFFKDGGDRSRVVMYLEKQRGGRAGKVEFKATDKFCRYESIDTGPDED
jgi:replicative DNA helicase